MSWKIEKYGGAWIATNGCGVTVWGNSREQLLAWINERDTQAKAEPEEGE